MKFIVGVIGALSLGTGIALADPPGSPSATTSTEPGGTSATATPAAPIVSATATQTDKPAAASASPAAHEVPAAPTASDARNLDQAQVEKQLRAKGYSIQMHNGEKVFCRRERVIGSNIPGPLSCLTAEQADTMAQNAQRDTEVMQQRHGNCISTGHGAPNCGS